jgi:hypothetical protein
MTEANTWCVLAHSSMDAWASRSKWRNRAQQMLWRCSFEAGEFGAESCVSNRIAVPMEGAEVDEAHELCCALTPQAADAC